MLKAASLTERCLQTTLLHLAGGASALQFISDSSMPLGAINCRQFHTRPQIASTCPPSTRILSSVCPDSLLKGSAREPVLRVSAADKDVAEVKGAEQVNKRVQNTPRRARQVSCSSSDNQKDVLLLASKFPWKEMKHQRFQFPAALLKTH